MADALLMTGLGAAFGLFFSCAGAGLATAPAGIFVLRSPGLKGFWPIIIAGVLALYGIIVAVILGFRISTDMTSSDGYRHFAAGLTVGLACLASGLCLKAFLDKYLASVKTTLETSQGEYSSMVGNCGEGKGDVVLEGTIPPMSCKFFLVMVYIEAIALYGLIVALILIG